LLFATIDFSGTEQMFFVFGRCPHTESATKEKKNISVYDGENQDTKI